MTSRRRWRIGWFVIGLMLPAVIWSAQLDGAPFSSPTAIRDNPTYSQTHNDGTELPPFDEPVFKSLMIERARDELTIKYGSAEEPVKTLYGAVKRHTAEGSAPIRLGDGSIRLAYVGVVTELPPGVERPRDLVLPPQYFTADLKPAEAGDSILQLEPHRLPLNAARLPTARFIFVSSNLTDVVTWQFHAFDARTHYPLCSWDYRDTPFRNTLRMDTPLKIWHQTPIEVVLTLSAGPTKTYSMAAAEGSELKLPIGAIKLLAIADGRFGDTKPAPPKPGEVTFMKTPAEESNDTGEFSLVFYCWPPAGYAPWEFEFVDDEGKAMDGGFKSGYRGVAIRGVIGVKERLKEIRVKYYPNLHRLSFAIPELPGLPEENRSLKNLFDVQVPYINTGSHFAVQQALGDLVQMDVKHIPFGSIKKPLQSERTNTTARALFEEIDRGMPEHHHLHVDEEKNLIQGVSRKPPRQPAQFTPPNLQLN